MHTSLRFGCWFAAMLLAAALVCPFVGCVPEFGRSSVSCDSEHHDFWAYRGESRQGRRFDSAG